MSKGLFPFSRKEISAKKRAINKAKKELEKLKKSKRWEEAFVLALNIIDEFNVLPIMWDILKFRKVDTRSLRENDNASSWFLLGCILYYGWGGVRKNSAEAYTCFCNATEKGHALAWKFKADTLPQGFGYAMNLKLSYQYRILAAELGCISEFCKAAHTYNYECSHWYPQNYMMAAYFYQIAGEHSKCYILLRQFPFECTPWGLWDHLDVDMQIRIMKPVRDAQFAWMLTSKRLQIPKGVALMITSLICTESGWK